MKKYVKPSIEIIEINTENIAVVGVSDAAGKGILKDFETEFSG